jgi:hypothetical protein
MNANNSTTVKILLVIVALLLGLVVGEAAGILAVLGGAAITEAIVAGCVAFGATVTLTVLLQNQLGG